MHPYDAILTEQLNGLRSFAEQRIDLERKRGDAEPDLYFAELEMLKFEFEHAVNVLRALLFDDEEQTREEYERARAAWVDYASKHLFQSAGNGSFRIGDNDPEGPTHTFSKYEDRRNAVDARIERIKEVS